MGRERKEGRDGNNRERHWALACVVCCGPMHVASCCRMGVMWGAHTMGVMWGAHTMGGHVGVIFVECGTCSVGVVACPLGRLGELQGEGLGHMQRGIG